MTYRNEAIFLRNIEPVPAAPHCPIRQRCLRARRPKRRQLNFQHFAGWRLTPRNQPNYQEISNGTLKRNVAIRGSS
jgi:hypothetical protein